MESAVECLGNPIALDLRDLGLSACVFEGVRSDYQSLGGSLQAGCGEHLASL
jgi:hypothetical protein